MDFIDLKTQYRRIKPAVDARVARVLEHGAYVMGPEVTELEHLLADYCGTRHCVAVASGSDALLIALLALEIGPGDEVVTVPFTFFATAEMVALIGARPVFVDIDPRTCNMDAARLAAAITPRTRAIIDEEVAARIRLGARYTKLIVEAFGKYSAGVRAPFIEPHNTSVYAHYTVEVDGREFVETRMKARGVPTAVHYPLPLHRQPVFEHLGQREGSFPVSEAAARRVISLPMHPYLSDADQVRVVSALQESVAA